MAMTTMQYATVAGMGCSSGQLPVDAVPCVTRRTAATMAESGLHSAIVRGMVCIPIQNPMRLFVKV